MTKTHSVRWLLGGVGEVQVFNWDGPLCMTLPDGMAHWVRCAPQSCRFLVLHERRIERAFEFIRASELATYVAKAPTCVACILSGPP